jgi:hypothetical protein
MPTLTPQNKKQSIAKLIAKINSHTEVAKRDVNALLTEDLKTELETLRTQQQKLKKIKKPTALNQYEKDRKKTQNEADEDTKAALGSKAKNAKQLSELGYNKSKTNKSDSLLLPDFVYLENSKQNDDRVLADYKQTFEDLGALTEDKVEEFAKLIQAQRKADSFDPKVVSSFLTKNELKK